MLNSKKVLLFLSTVFFFLPSLILAQTVTIQGSIKDGQTGEAVPGVEVRLLRTSVFSDSDGAFRLTTSSDARDAVVSFSRPGFANLDTLINLSSGNINLGVLNLASQAGIDQLSGEEVISTVTLSSDEGSSEGAQNIAGVLTASNDLFASTAAFGFSAARFRIRGYDSDNNLIYLNNIPVNDQEDGFVFWNAWGGLNDAVRSRSNSIGLQPTEYTFGGVGGAVSIDTRASSHRKQLRVSYAISNRTYRHRLMATYSTGMKNGWALTLSASRRWADEGYVAGTSYDAWSYFLSVDRKLNDRHTLNLTALGAPIIRGRSTSSVQEMYDLAGTNFYNSYWGYQNGKKRNSQMVNTHQPLAILRHDWSISNKTSMTTAISYEFGRDGLTALDWYNARDPRPDYYRRLPSYIENDQRDDVEQLLRENEELRQVDWAHMYEANRNSIQTIADADGIEGNDVTGKRSQYVVEERRADMTRASFNSNFRSAISDNFTLTAGLSYQSQTTKYFKVLDDLLGGDFYLDIDKFAEFGNVGNNEVIQNDLSTINKLVQEGEKFGYNYDIVNNRAGAWVQGEWKFNKFDFFAAANANNSRFWREGNVQNGRFENSIGKSEVQSFVDYGVKGGVTYKLNGRNYFVLNGAYLTRAPFTRNAYLSPRTRADFAEGAVLEKILSAEVNYLLRSPGLKIKATGYFTQFDDQINIRSFYLDNALVDDSGVSGGFVNYIMSNISTQHMGMELAAEVATPITGLKAKAVAAIGENIYTNRPDVEVFLDQDAASLGKRQVYIKNFYVAGSPQTAMTFTLSYNAKAFWFANLSFNYFDNSWIDFFPERRTTDAVSYVDDPDYINEVVEPGSPLWKEIIDQQKAPSAFTMDFFGGKSWKINNLFIYLNVGVNNLLDKKDFITGGYEQYRFDFEGKNVNRFPPRYFYGFGRNYFVSLAFRI